MNKMSNDVLNLALLICAAEMAVQSSPGHM
uniref:Uncharacterized protein n=1 Tax=Anguilla anguilla TaxID=7936 RepID=A0A0E9XA24_ANGAN